MGKSIRMVWTSPDNCLFLYGINDKEELVFRTSRNIKRLQIENFTIDNDKCYLNSYFFHVGFLNNLPIL